MRRLVIVALLLGFAAPALAQEPVRLDPIREIERRRIEESEGNGGRSGFWTSRTPAKGGAYRWRLLGIGLGLIGLTGGGMFLLVRRAKRDNLARQTKDKAKTEDKLETKATDDKADTDDKAKTGDKVADSDAAETGDKVVASDAAKTADKVADSDGAKTGDKVVVSDAAKSSSASVQT